MRPSCLNCARKHLACALININEAKLDGKYRSHEWLAMGHLCEAEAELLQEYLHLSLEIREHRKAYEQDRGYSIPIMDLINRLTAEADDLQKNLSSKEV